MKAIINGKIILQDGIVEHKTLLFDKKIVALADARTFELYSRNMTAQMMDKLRNADMIVMSSSPVLSSVLMFCS